MTENQAQFEKRMIRIKMCANKNIKKAHPGDCTFPVRDTVLVDYDDLMEIWNLADLALNETAC